MYIQPVHSARGLGGAVLVGGGVVVGVVAVPKRFFMVQNNSSGRPVRDYKESGGKKKSQSWNGALPKRKGCGQGAIVGTEPN